MRALIECRPGSNRTTPGHSDLERHTDVTMFAVMTPTRPIPGVWLTEVVRQAFPAAGTGRAPEIGLRWC